MFPTLKQRGRTAFAKHLPHGIEPRHLEWKNGIALISFSDGAQSLGSCIHCPDMPCIEYNPSELMVPGLGEFPADMDPHVCPTEAISWPLTSGSPHVNSEECLSCGLCVARCPVAAISLSVSGAAVNDAENSHFRNSDEPVTQEIVDQITALFEDLPEEGSIVRENDEFLEQIYGRIQNFLTSTPKLPQHLTRNLLLGLDNHCAMRRQGDTNVRMELVFSNELGKGTAEVEMGIGGLLEAPRNILDNIAVLAARYNISKEEIDALIVSLIFPNQRSDYWQVIKDIKDVVEIKIGSITIGALMVLLWNRQTVIFAPDSQVYSDSTSHSIRAALEKLLGRSLNISQGHLGIVESFK